MNTEEKDIFYDEAVAFVKETRKPFPSAIQRKFRISYYRAARIIEQMVAEGIMSDPSYNGSREVLVPPTKDLTDKDIEAEIQEKGLTAPRVTPDVIEQLLAGVTYHTHIVPGTTTTVATAIMANGFTLATGISACASPENFDAELGAKIAISNATTEANKELWKLEGYRLKRNLEQL